jgi:hypothetical protein
MENEDNLYDQLVQAYGRPCVVTDNVVYSDNFESPYNRPIEIPKTFKDVVIKMFPEIMDIVSSGYRDNVMYSPETFDPIKQYLVGVDLYFEEKNGMKKSKKEYGDELTDYFKMTYSELDFITFHVRSFIFPPEKSNEEKFFELFGVIEK